MRNTYWILGFIIVAILVVFFVVLKVITGSPNTPVASTTTSSSAVSNTSVVTSSPAANDSSTTLAEQVLHDSDTKSDPDNSGQYFLGNALNPENSTASDTPPYVITYIAGTNSFSIALLQEPIGAARMEAEQYLMQHFSLTEGQMCALDYTVSTPAYVNSTYAGTSLGFSFCPGAVQLP
jgi:hypothetical protein